MIVKKAAVNKNYSLFNIKIALSPILLLVALYLILQTFSIASATDANNFPTPTNFCPDDICDVTPPSCDDLNPSCGAATPTIRITSGEIATPTLSTTKSPTTRPTSTPSEEIIPTKELTITPSNGGGGGIVSPTPTSTPTQTPSPTSVSSSSGSSSSGGASSTSSSSPSSSGGGGEVLGLAETGSFVESISSAFFMLSISFFGLSILSHAKKKK
ncbi:hypothetical protein A3C23_00965 [Candidatus Roizmanbacteria bacterium RIFCSPHIGHO2_02_FULL_37_13b]|uniref:Uncharacterized protein n=1 Tax=Candidatus Roizmanbacteria bacterium RIFCSPLOWO2_02_FULL_36_11 TaxID=1802071 RepID=A0A1F7JIX9_9BACT|nr:MAG: hypothetical protein A3C23_00965 [Candidatus Roizmanbacteria bacterium RIFCSPHIGHO2_02_FULL_37_13b]OGK55536.1 MAG: hypothetical protein A3H78_05220 [Candidatus Roizmanbacteria bacterium RIFCSPLOWO2_02_FULL_36_11]